MAARYWIGGTGNWSDPLHWSSTSGGSGAEVSGNMKIIGGDVSADTVTLKTLKVTNVQPGSGTSGVPVQ